MRSSVFIFLLSAFCVSTSFASEVPPPPPVGSEAVCDVVYNRKTVEKYLNENCDLTKAFSAGPHNYGEGGVEILVCCVKK